MPDFVEFPPNLRITDRSDPMLMPNTRSGGPGLSGDEQILSPLSARWEWRATVIVRNTVDARSLRVVKSTLQGRYGYLRVKLCDRSRITRRDIGAVDPAAGVTYSDGTLFSDGTGFSLAEPSAPIMAAAAAGASQITVLASAFAGAITAGVFFSINDWLHQVEAWEEDGSNYVLTIAPALREAVTTSDEADFSGRSIWQVMADDVGDIALRLGRTGAVELQLVEPVGRRLGAA